MNHRTFPITCAHHLNGLRAMPNKQFSDFYGYLSMSHQPDEEAPPTGRVCPVYPASSCTACLMGVTAIEASCRPRELKLPNVMLNQETELLFSHGSNGIALPSRNVALMPADSRDAKSGRAVIQTAVYRLVSSGNAYLKVSKTDGHPITPPLLVDI